MKHDVLIVGGGTAGLNAALVLARACRRVMVVDADRPRNAPSEHLHGYLTRDGMNPGQLLDIGRSEVLEVGGEIRQGCVTALTIEGPQRFMARLDDGSTVEARAVLIATGLRDELPNIAGIQEHWGKQVVHCPYCHGYEVRGTALGVVGGDNRPFSMHQAALVRQWSHDVVFFPNTITIDPIEHQRLAARGIRIVEGQVNEVLGTGDGLDVILANGERVRRSTVFVGPRFTPAVDLLHSLGCAHDESGFPTTDSTGLTDIPGVWAAGNVNDSPAQLINAASAGSRAAIALNHHLLAYDIDHAVTDMAAQKGG
jgi:thioredoxin reductase (NADPH)